MDEVKFIPEKGSRLATLELTRFADGKIGLVLADMPPALIETTGVEVSDRLGIIADWIDEGARWFRNKTASLATPSKEERDDQ